MRNRIILILALFVLNACSLHAQFSDVSSLLNINTTVATTYNGNGLSFYDFNQDGWDDITIGRGFLEPIFLINNEGVFTPAPFTIPNANTKQIMMIMWADYDGDADLDLFITKMNGPLELWQNDGEFNFTNVAASAGLDTSNLYYTGAAFCDVDHDGDLDLYVAKFYHPTIGLSAEKDAVFYTNNGDGTFTDTTVDTGVHVGQRPTFQPIFLDFDRDGWEDLYLITDRIFVENALFKNNGDGTFTNVTADSGAGIMICSMSGTVGDYDNDLDLDVFITNSPSQGSKMLENNGDETFTEVSEAMGVNIHQIGWGSLWIDYDNDSWQDLFVGLTAGQPNFPGNHFYHNNAGTGFTNMSSELGILNEISETFVCAMGDINNDGYHDMLLNNKQGYLPKLYQSNTGVNNYLSVSLTGVTSNLQGIGSWIHCFAGGNEYVRYTLCGENLIGQNSGKYIFGLDSIETVDSLVVEWNRGIRDVYYNISANQHLVVVEGMSAYENLQPVASATYLCENDSIIISLPDIEVEITWSNGDTGNVATVAEPGVYWAYVTTPLGTVAQTQSVILLPAPEIYVDIDYSGETCFEMSDGYVIITDSQGAFELVEWNHGSAAMELYDLEPGPYGFILTDTLGCLHQGALYIEPATEIFTMIFANETLCFGDSTGSAEAFVFGGQVPFILDWYGQDNNMLPAGTYNLTVTDNAGCQITSSFTIGQPEPLSAEITMLQPGNVGETGSASVDVFGGNPPYSYLWSNGVTNLTQVTDLEPGSYTLLITDGNGCTVDLSFDVEVIVGIQAINPEKCRLFPNPVYAYLSIEDCNLTEVYSYVIYDLQGSVQEVALHHVHGSPIDVQNLREGMYYIRIDGAAHPVPMAFLKTNNR